MINGFPSPRPTPLTPYERTRRQLARVMDMLTHERQEAARRLKFIEMYNLQAQVDRLTEWSTVPGPTAESVTITGSVEIDSKLSQFGMHVRTDGLPEVVAQRILTTYQQIRTGLIQDQFSLQTIDTEGMIAG